MYQGMQSQLQGYNNNYYQNANPYGAQYQQRYMPMEQSQTAYPMTPTTTYLKGRPVLSVEEAKASQIDLDGSLHVFTDIGNKKIYTKQLNLDGTATLNTYILVEDDAAVASSSSIQTQQDFITRAEFEQTLAQIREIFTTKAEGDKKATILNF